VSEPGRELDRVELHGLRARGRHGVLAHERALGQDFVVDVVLHLDTRPAAAADDLKLTVDYGALAERVVAVIAGDPVDLIETLAQRIADVALAPAPVQAVDVRVHKPHAPVSVPFADVVVAIHRERS
jgi:dihydroneopterin aldolase